MNPRRRTPSTSFAHNNNLSGSPRQSLAEGGASEEPPEMRFFSPWCETNKDVEMWVLIEKTIKMRGKQFLWAYRVKLSKRKVPSICEQIVFSIPPKQEWIFEIRRSIIIVLLIATCNCTFPIVPFHIVFFFLHVHWPHHVTKADGWTRTSSRSLYNDNAHWTDWMVI